MIALGSNTTGITGTLDLLITLDLTIDTLGDAFRTNLILANVPEPSAAALLLLGAAHALALRRRRAEPSAA